MYEINRNYDINYCKMDISGSGYAVLDSNWKSDNVCDPFSRLYFIKRGSGFVKYKNTITELKGGNMYLIPADLTFSYGCIYLEKLYFHISITKKEKYELLSSVKGIFSLPFPEKEFELLYKAYITDNYMDLLYLKTVLYKSVTQFSETYRFKSVPIKTYSETVKKTMHYIQHHTKINLSVKSIAKSLFVSESKIRNAFKKEVGVTVGEYIDDLVFLKAKKMLAQKGILMREISEKLGFCDQFYFSRRFREKYNKTPTEYRNETIF